MAGDFDPAQLGVGLDAMAEWRAEIGDARARTRVGWGADATVDRDPMGRVLPAIRPKRVSR